jgi:3-hydroxybutyryl-CoA dehydrogenase
MHYSQKSIGFWMSIASRDDVDTAVRLSIGPRLALWGPLLTEDIVVSKKTTLAVVEYLYQQTGDANFSPRSVLRELVDEGSVGAMCGKGWYEFSGDCPSVVKERDQQLLDLLSWLRQKDPVSRIGINTE